MEMTVMNVCSHYGVTQYAICQLVNTMLWTKTLLTMKKDLQKPILYKADPDIFMHLENMKDTARYKFNRNQFLNNAARLYIELVKLMQSPEYAYLNEVSFNDAHLQKILYDRLKTIAFIYPPKRSE